MGELCLPACTRDTECRADEGYVCERGACTLPNLAVIAMPSCPGPSTRDRAFGDQELLGFGDQPVAVPAKPFAALWETAGGIAGTLIGTAPFAAIGRDVFVARDATTIYAVWRDSETIELTTSSDDGATWTQPHPVQADDGAELGRPFLAASRKAVFLFHGIDDRGLRLRVSRDRGASWAAASTILRGAYGNAVVDDAGALHVVTINGTPLGGYGSAMQTIDYAVSRDDGATFASQTIAADQLLPTYFANPSIAVDARRRWIYIAYVRGGRDAHWELVIAASHDAGKTWSRRTIGDGCAIHLVPNLALDGVTGTLHLAYYDNAGAPRFTHATCTIGATSCTAWGAINSEPFGTLPLSRHAPWLGDREALIIDRSRTLHAFWTQPILEGGAITSRVFHASAKLR